MSSFAEICIVASAMECQADIIDRYACPMLGDTYIKPQAATLLFHCHFFVALFLKCTLVRITSADMFRIQQTGTLPKPGAQFSEHGTPACSESERRLAGPHGKSSDRPIYRNALKAVGMRFSHIPLFPYIIGGPHKWALNK